MKFYLATLTVLLLGTQASCNPAVTKNNFKDLIEEGKDVYFKDVTFDEDIDFTIFDKNLISENVYQVKVTSSVTFQDCKFKGKVISFKKSDDNTVTITSFQSNLSFMGCTFNEDASFRAASVAGRTDFTNSVFLKTANFEECTFFQNAYFRACGFHEELRFQNSVFMGKANFLNADFDATASFQQATFHGEAQFSSTVFAGYADFGIITCHSSFFSNYAQFYNWAIFNSAFFFGQADIRNCTFERCEVKNSKFYAEARFLESTANESMNFENTFFLFGMPDLYSFQKSRLNLTGVKTGN